MRGKEGSVKAELDFWSLCRQAKVPQRKRKTQVSLLLKLFRNLQYNSVETDITQLQNDYLSKRNSNPQLATGQTINYANKIPNLNSKESNLLPLDLKFQSTRRSTDALESKQK